MENQEISERSTIREDLDLLSNKSGSKNNRPVKLKQIEEEPTFSKKSIERGFGFFDDDDFL